MRSLFSVTVLTAVMVGCSSSVQTPTQTAASAAREEAASEQPAAEFSVGDAAPEFKDLAGIDGKQHSLQDYADAKAVALVFTCNHCPVAQAYEDRLVALQSDYADKGVKLVAINVNNMEEDKLPAMKERAEEKGFQFAYLYDPTQQVGRDYGATVTPHVFLLDGQRQLAYVGPVDDSQDVANVTKSYLRDAIDAVLAGKAPETNDVTPFGCGIQYE